MLCVGLRHTNCLDKLGVGGRWASWAAIPERPTVGSFPWRATLLPGCVVGSFAPPRRPLCCLSPANATEGPHSAPLNAAPHYKGAASCRARSKGAATDELMALITV